MGNLLLKARFQSRCTGVLQPANRAEGLGSFIGSLFQNPVARVVSPIEIDAAAGTKRFWDLLRSLCSDASCAVGRATFRLTDAARREGWYQRKFVSLRTGWAGLGECSESCC